MEKVIYFNMFPCIRLFDVAKSEPRGDVIPRWRQPMFPPDLSLLSNGFSFPNLSRSPPSLHSQAPFFLSTPWLTPTKIWER